MVCWLVFGGGTVIDKVFYLEGFDKEYIKDTLVNHDGYPPYITVRREHEGHMEVPVYHQ